MSNRKKLGWTIIIIVAAVVVTFAIVINNKLHEKKTADLANVEDHTSSSSDTNDDEQINNASGSENTLHTSGVENSGAENTENSSSFEKNSSGAETNGAQNSHSKSESTIENPIAENAAASEAAENQVAVPVELIDTLQPGTVIDEASISDSSAYFKIYEINEGDDIYNRINGKSYRQNNNISLSDLRYLKLLYYDFNNQIKVGEIIVNKSIADSTLSVFKDLFAEKYQIHSVELVDNYWTGDGASTDIASQAADNTSAFNYRMTTSGKKLSNHALGKAIDINPLENPYIITENGVQHCDIDASAPYFDRASGLPHMILKGDACESVFEKYGFKWGGDWTNPVDYQHFEKK